MNRVWAASNPFPCAVPYLFAIDKWPGQRRTLISVHFWGICDGHVLARDEWSVDWVRGFVTALALSASWMLGILHHPFLLSLPAWPLVGTAIFVTSGWMWYVSSYKRICQCKLLNDGRCYVGISKGKWFFGWGISLFGIMRRMFIWAIFSPLLSS